MVAAEISPLNYPVLMRRDPAARAGFPSRRHKVIMTAIGSFDDVVTFGCTGLPAGVAFNFTPPGLSPGAQGQTPSSFTITPPSPHRSGRKGREDCENQSTD